MCKKTDAYRTEKLNSVLYNVIKSPVVVQILTAFPTILILRMSLHTINLEFIWIMYMRVVRGKVNRQRWLKKVLLHSSTRFVATLGLRAASAMESKRITPRVSNKSGRCSSYIFHNKIGFGSLYCS